MDCQFADEMKRVSIHMQHGYHRSPGPTMRLVLLALLVSSAAVAGALAPSGSSVAASLKIVAFTDASNTVVCQLVRDDVDKLRCDQREGKVRPALPPKPEYCDFVWNPTVFMDSNDVRIAQWGTCLNDAIGNPPARQPGEVIKLGVFKCRILDPGVKCSDTQLTYGFKLTPKGMKWTRPSAKPKLSAEGIAALRLGMNRAEAVATGQTGEDVCGQPQLSPDLKLRVFLGWRKKRFFSAFANLFTNVQTKKRVGVGSTLGQVQKQYDGLVEETTDLVEGTKEYVFVTEGERGKLVFLLQTFPGDGIGAATPVNGLWAVREWVPKDGYGFSGC